MIRCSFACQLIEFQCVIRFRSDTSYRPIPTFAN